MPGEAHGVVACDDAAPPRRVDRRLLLRREAEVQRRRRPWFEHHLLEALQRVLRGGGRRVGGPWDGEIELRHLSSFDGAGVADLGAHFD